MGKKTPLVLTVYVAAILPFSFASLAQGAENEVTPEMAKKAAVYYFVKGRGRFCSEEFEYFRISEPKIIKSYRGDRKWYNFYFTVGADPLPTRAELADWVKAGQIEPKGGYIFHLDIAADKEITPCSISCSGIPSEIKQRPDVEKYVRAVSGVNKIKLLRVFYTTVDLREKAACFEFEAGGKRYIVNGFHLRQYTPDEVPEEPRDSTDVRIRKIWDAIEEKVPFEKVRDEKVFFRDFSNLIGKLNGGRTDEPDYLFCDDVPNYYRYGDGAPYSTYTKKNDWGCGPRPERAVNVFRKR